MTVGGQGAKLFYLSGVIHGEYQKTEVRALVRNQPNKHSNFTGKCQN
jgi:hypothetical protein